MPKPARPVAADHAGALPIRGTGWDVLIDVDELARTDDANWVWAGADVIEPDHTRA